MISIDRFIKLITKEQLDLKIIKKWFHCVKEFGPSGVIQSANTTDDQGTPKTISLVHRVSDEQHCYLVPLSRDLSDKEIEVIINYFMKAEPDLDFNVETNEVRVSAKDSPGISLDASKHLALCQALAKQQHEDWVRERTDAGWRYGSSFDADEKTHPLIQPWTNLPDRYRQPDMAWPQKLIDILNSQGYAVIEKGELEKLIASLKGDF